ncbi:uncharacterized protein LOC118434536 [Folsomia candida]|uniref:Dopamine N-acetyltransferase n=1 Tax=Folsomia candida TaxID=158441 RepID=A0A226ENV2_FOLCA|nr:uncharacterized protein LOC118434536 [Folsomia candida]OXA59312.1 Dopamine N-acetyltransferase [Folsomia candida]
MASTWSSSDLFALVEGPWKEDYLIKRILPEDLSRVLEHVRTHFLQDEPTCNLLLTQRRRRRREKEGCSNNTDQLLFEEEIQSLVRIVVRDELSFLVEDVNTGELAAIRITYRSTKATDFPIFSSPCMKELFRLTNLLEKEANLFEKFGVGEIARFFIASCTPKYRRRGITTELYRRSLIFLKASGFRLAESMFTNPFTRCCAVKFGFQEVVRIEYKDYRNENDDGFVFRGESSQHHFAAIMVKVL